MHRYLLATILAALVSVGSPAPAPALQSTLARLMHRRTLENGLEVIVVTNPAVPLATALVAVRNGAFTQDSGEAGLAHLYEHILFRSYGRGPTAFGLEVMKLRGEYNGTTSEEVVDYFVMVPSQNVESAIGLLADLLRKARFSNGDLKDERPVVLDELQRSASDPERELQRRIERMLWGSAWHRKDVGGDSGSIQGISVDRLKATYARYYVPNNAALIITGDVDPERVFAVAQRKFGEWKAAPNPFVERPVPPIALRTSTAAVLLAKDVLDVTIAVALYGPSVDLDPGATYAADVFFDIFNDPASAFQTRLVDSGLFQSISGRYLTLDHVGPIQISGKTTPDQMQNALLTLLAELDQLDSLSGVTDDDLRIAKKHRQVDAALMFERTASLAPTLAFWWSSAGMDYFSTYDEHLAGQTVDSLRRFARDYVVGKPRVIGVLGAPDLVSQVGEWLRRGVRPAPEPQKP